jgi:hypothetical protein
MTTKVGINGFGHIGRLDWSQILRMRLPKKPPIFRTVIQEACRGDMRLSE